jgi:hypothetical protein
MIGALIFIALCLIYALGLWLDSWGILNASARDRGRLAGAASVIGCSIVATWLVIAGTWWFWGYLLSQP